MCNVTADRLVIPNVVEGPKSLLMCNYPLFVIPSVVEESNSYCHPRPNPVISTAVQRSGEISIQALTICEAYGKPFLRPKHSSCRPIVLNLSCHFQNFKIFHFLKMRECDWTIYKKSRSTFYGKPTLFVIL